MAENQDYSKIISGNLRFQKISEIIYETYAKSPFIVLCKLGIFMDQYG
jgi:hypothetical protein